MQKKNVIGVFWSILENVIRTKKGIKRMLSMYFENVIGTKKECYPCISRMLSEQNRMLPGTLPNPDITEQNETIVVGVMSMKR